MGDDHISETTELPRTVNDPRSDSSVVPPQLGKYALTRSPRTIGDRIRLRTMHSSGGIGEVWLAHDELLQREVALKRLKSEQSGSANHRNRFFREARITGQLDHPGIVPVYDYSTSEDGTQCYYTMRFVQGRTLRQVIRAFHAERQASDFPLVGGDLLELLSYFSSICNTMAFAHSRGVIHRDIKGDNIIVGDFGEVIILDWGLAKELDVDETIDPEDSDAVINAGRTLHGQLLGTPSYMAPEQALGKLDALDHRTDIYGLCAVLYEILTGRPPFIGDDVHEVISAVIENEPTPPRELVPEIPFDLEKTCLRGLSKDPAERHRSVMELDSELRSWLGRLAERTRAEQEREHFFGISDDLLAIVNHAGRIEQSNPSWERQLGATPADRLGRHFIDFIEPRFRDKVRDHLDMARSNGESLAFDARVSHRGKKLWIHWILRSLPETGQFYLVGRDVSELKNSEQRFRSFVESAPDATCVVDGQGGIRLVNAALEKMFGFSREELVGQTIEYLVPSALRERHRGHVERYMNTPAHRPMGSALNLLAQNKDGETFPVEISLGPVRSDGELLMSCAIRKAEDRRRPDRRALALLDASPDPLVALDQKGTLLHANQAALRFLGVPRASLQDRGLRDFLTPSGARDLRNAIEAILEEGRSDSMELRFSGGTVSSPRAVAHLSSTDTEDGPLLCLSLRTD
jgi:PAS domain S-box-containing protein